MRSTSLAGRVNTWLVVASLILSLTTWGIYAAAYLGKAGDEMEQPLLLLSFGNPILAIAGVFFTVSRIDMEARQRWWGQVIASIVSAILAIVALIMIFALP